MVEKGDFTAKPRLIFISTIALVVGALCALVAVVLMWLIGFFTNVFFYHQLAVTFRSPRVASLKEPSSTNRGSPLSP